MTGIHRKINKHALKKKKKRKVSIAIIAAAATDEHTKYTPIDM